MKSKTYALKDLTGLLKNFAIIYDKYIDAFPGIPRLVRHIT